MASSHVGEDQEKASLEYGAHGILCYRRGRVARVFSCSGTSMVIENRGGRISEPVERSTRMKKLEVHEDNEFVRLADNSLLSLDTDFHLAI